MKIEATDLTKTYDGVTALDGLTLTVPSGSTFGLLGTNGAGKTTLFRLLIGHEQPDEGTVELDGEDVTTAGHGVRDRIGYLPERAGFPPELTGREVLSVTARVRGLSAGSERIDETLELVGLADAADRAVEGYSNGMQRRLGLAAALLPDPDVLLLDEPTAGLDPLGVATFHRIVEDVRDRTGATVLVCSHALAEVERLCDRAAILHDGQVRSIGPVADLVPTDGETRPVRIRCEDPARRSTVAERCRAYGDVEIRADRVTVDVPREDAVDLLADLDGDVGLDGVELLEPGLEEAFQQAVEKPDGREEGLA